MGFPGGRVDDDEFDHDSGDSNDVVASARRAAVREVNEETGLTIDYAELETWSYWIPPPMPVMKAGGIRRRFSTWFFVAPSPGGDVAVDGGEIHEHRWLTPSAAIAQREAGEIEIVPPTWVTLHQLAQHDSVDAAMSWARTTAAEEFRTRPIAQDPTTLAWAGDVAHGGGAPDDAGSRHRLIMAPDGWRYERTSTA